jgi:hypothetical protein
MIDLKRLFGVQWAPDLELQDDEFYRGPHIHTDEPDSACGEVYLAAPKPRWTTDPPEHPGYFWVKPQHDDTPLVVEVYLTKHNQLYARWSDVPAFRVPMSRPAGAREGLRWSDRAIPVPVETH